MKWVLILVFFLIQTVQAKELEKFDMTFSNGKRLKVELADDFDSRGKGLMHRTSMGEDEGMLFKFDFPQHLSFWTKNTFIPLSLAYLDKNKVIKEIHHMEPVSMMSKKQNIKEYPSQCLCAYALEVNQGWFKKNNVKVGDKFKLRPAHRETRHKSK